MLLLIDNYGSFTYNTVQYFAKLGRDAEVRRSDDIALEAIVALKPRCLIIGPGPCTPKGTGISIVAIQHFASKLPIMGVCLSHQAIGEAFGGGIVHAQTPMHGKVSPVFRHGKGMFKNPPDPVTYTRYHSLVTSRATLPECLEITSWTENNEIVGVRHKSYAVGNVQSHPEALLTEHGHDIPRNFLEKFKDFKAT